MNIGIANQLIVGVVVSRVLTPVTRLSFERVIQPRLVDTCGKREDDVIENADNPVIVAGFGRFGGGPPPGIRVLPGSYEVAIEGSETGAVAAVVKLDPRVQISDADLAARQAAMEQAYEMAAPFRDAGRCPACRGA